MASRDNPVRKKTITVRYKTPSRDPISITVTQVKDELGNWLMPTLLWNGPQASILESARYAEDAGKALIVAAYFADQYALRVKELAFENIESEVIIEEDE